MKLLIACILVLTGLLCSTSNAGEISPELKRQLDTCKSDQMIRVWIRLPQAENPELLKMSVNAAVQTREARYKLAYERLKIIHQSCQQDLVLHLGLLRQSGKCWNINPSWLSNVIEVEVTAGELEALSRRNDVERIYSVPMLVSIKPDTEEISIPENQAVQAAIDTNLKFIKAPQAWAAGYTGAGRVVCSFDTGVDGDHPALLNKWRGLNADSSAAWLDQKTQSSFPYPVLGDNHGTHVMGIMVGHNGADTVGVAFNAKWISAAVVDINGASYIDAFEWAANPDGEPNNVADVPDVINHSWGIPQIGCQEVFYEIIDNLEALGIVNIFACGNDGPGGSTIRNPANGANDSLDCFAVGNVNTNNPPSVLTSSSRGPSDCTGAIKPNVCAPGQSIRSTNIGTGYTFLTGTSVATPHVSGLVALLRQKNPNATVDQIKNAILTTTQFRPSPLNNNIGWGVINCQAALNALSSSNPVPNVRVYKYEHSPISAGSSVGGIIVLQNLGAAVTPLSATLIQTDPAMTVIDGSFSVGGIGLNDTLRASDSIRVTVSDTVSDGTILSAGLRITNNSTFTDTLMLFFIVEPALERSFVTHDLGLVNFTVSNFGTYSFGPGGFVPIGGTGFSYNGGGNDIFESGLMFGNNAAHISDGTRNSVGEPDGDFRVMPGGNIDINLPGAGSAQKTRSKYDDFRSENPNGFEVRQFTYTFAETELNDLVIMRYLIKNANLFPVTGVRVGLYLDWDIFSFDGNAGGYDAGSQILWMAFNNGTTLSRYRGAVMLDGSITGGWTSPTNVVQYPEGFTETEKFNAMGVGFATAAIHINDSLDLFQIISAGPLSFSAGETKTITFALLAGNSLADLQNSANSAATVNDTLLNSCCVELRGDLNSDGTNLNILDLTFVVDRIFRGGPAPNCPQEADANGDGSIMNVLDLSFVVDRIFRSGPPPIPCPGY